MRRNRFFLVTESSRNDPETVSAPPHRVLFSPYHDLHTNPGCRPSTAGGGLGGVTEGMSMVQLVAFRRSLVALALCSAAIAASATPASARSHHGEGRHAHGRHAGYHARRHYAH